jgi:hypothetical protein
MEGAAEGRLDKLNPSWFVRFLLFAYDCDIELVVFPSLFPGLQVQITTSDNDLKDSGDLVHHPDQIRIAVFKPVSIDCLFTCVLATPMRQSIRTKAFLAGPRLVHEVSLGPHGYIYDDGRLDLAGEHSWTPLCRHPSTVKFDIFSLQPRGLHLGYEQSLLTPDADFDSAPVEHLVDSLFELMKIVGSSDIALRDGMNPSSDDYESPVYPLITVHLSPKHLPRLIERVSQKKPL